MTTATTTSAAAVRPKLSSLASTGTDHAYGGAIYARGGVETLYSTIRDSSATAPQGNSGGGAIWASYALVLASTISGNTVSGDGSHYSRGGGVALMVVAAP